jgi:hypothetical protein
MDFEEDDYINDRLQEIKEICPKINTVEKLWQIYEFLMDNRPSFYDFISDFS